MSATDNVPWCADDVNLKTLRSGKFETACMKHQAVSNTASVIIIIIIIIWHYKLLWVFAFLAKSVQGLLSITVSFQV